MPPEEEESGRGRAEWGLKQLTASQPANCSAVDARSKWTPAEQSKQWTGAEQWWTVRAASYVETASGAEVPRHSPFSFTTDLFSDNFQQNMEHRPPRSLLFKIPQIKRTFLNTKTVVYSPQAMPSYILHSHK